MQTLVLTRLPSGCCFPVTFHSTYTQNAFHIISDLVPAKSIAVDKSVEADWTGQYRPHCAWARCHHYNTVSTISGSVVLLPGRLPISLHSCEIKSRWGQGTSLSTTYWQSSTRFRWPETFEGVAMAILLQLWTANTFRRSCRQLLAVLQLTNQMGIRSFSAKTTHLSVNQKGFHTTLQKGCSPGVT